MDAQILRVQPAHMANARKIQGKPRHYIKAWRKFRGYTLEALAAKIGTTHATLSRIERGKLDYSGDYLERLAWALKCTPSDLLGRNPDEKEVA